MRNRTRLIALLLLLTLLLGLFAGCGEDTNETEAPNKDAGVNSNAPQFSLEELPADQKLQNMVTRAPGDGRTKEYTLMVYIVGSDLESSPNGGCASIDITEMMDSGIDASRVNLLIYTGGSRYWHNNIPSNCNAIYQIVNGGAELVANTQAPANMGDSATFLDFLDYTYTNFPANHYGLICWDHGGGPLGGFGLDELSGDRLYLQEMDVAFKSSPFASKKLDFLGFDACLMATMEVAEMADNYANYLIASEENEPGTGWDYSFLSTLNSTSDTQTIARSVLNAYEKSMDLYQVTPKYTLSCLDLSRLGSFRSAADKLYAQMASGVKNGNYSAIAKARNKTQRFAQTAETPYDLVDMGHMAKNLKSLYSSEVSTFQSALSKLVIQQVSNISNTTGLSVYYPYDSKDGYDIVGQYFYTDLSECAGYESFVAAFTDYWINGEPAANFTEHQVEEPPVATPTAPTEPEPTQPPTTAPAAPAAPVFNGASLQLTTDQIANLSEATYTVFQADIDASSGQTVYIPVLSDIPLEPDSSGKVTLPKDQKLVVLKTDENASGILWPSQRLKGTASDTYLSIDGYLTTSMDIAGSQRIALGFTEGKSNRMNILTITNLGNSDTVGRSEPDLTQWEYIANSYVTLFPTCNNAGILTDYTMWDDSGDTYYQLLSYKNDFWLEQVHMTELKEQFFVQIVLKDTQGNTYASDVIEYYNGNTYAEYVQDGVVYHIYADHAEVVDYTGKGGEVTIAKEVSGKKVTVIAPEAFYFNRDLTYVYLPEHLEIVGERAFASCRNLTGAVFMGSVKEIHSDAFAKSGLTLMPTINGAQRIESGAFSGTALSVANIPSTVGYMGSGVFADCVNLVGCTLDGLPNNESAYFMTVNGTLYTADGKELVQAPLGGNTTLAIPEGVETIRSGAVRGSEKIKEVIFPESLKHIESYAFYDTLNLQSLTFPESLETIGHSAFGQFGVSLNTASPITSVNIGPNVRWIGYDAFDAFPIASFYVHGLNEHYSVKGGSLLNKSGTVFLHAPYTYNGTLNIPKGVNHLAFHSLNRCDNIKSLVLDDSVVSMDKNVGLPDTLTSLSVGRGLARWDNISDTYYIADVTISSENPYFILHDECIYSRDLTVLYACLSKKATLNVADTVTTIQETAFAPATGYNETLTKITLPASVNYLSGEIFSNCRTLENVEIHTDNANYASHDGMVYTKNGVSLILCPQGKTGTVSVRIGTTTIWRYAFAGQLKASRIVIPEGVQNIRKGNFVTYRDETLDLQLPGTLVNIYPDMFRSSDGYQVTCPAGSAAEIFTRSRGVIIAN